MKKTILFFISLLLFFSSFAFVHAAEAEHGINGYVSDSRGSANGAIAIFYIEARPWEMLTDIVGSQGNSLQDNWYAIDIKNFETPWQDGDVLKIMVMKGECKGAVTALVIDSSVNEQQAPNLVLDVCGEECPECSINGSLLGVCWYGWLFLGIILAIIVYYIVKKQILEKKKLYEKEKPLKKGNKQEKIGKNLSSKKSNF